MKNEEKIMNYVEYRLQQWADWYTRGNLYGLGYPSTSVEYRLMTEGNIIRNQGSRSLSTNDDAEEIEILVKKMSEQNQVMALALRCHYFDKCSLRMKAEKLQRLGVKISHNHFKYYVDMAQQWLAGRLSI